MNNSEAIEQVKNSYEQRAMDILRKIRDKIREAGMSADDEPFDLSGDSYQWNIRAWRTPEPGKVEQCIDITFEIPEARIYEGDDGQFGINFGITIVEWGGRILGGLEPFNFTPEVWVDARDATAVEARFKLIEDADTDEIPTLIRK